MSNQTNFDDPNSFFDRVLTGSSNQAQFWSRRSFWGAILMTAAILVLVSVIWLSYIGAPDISSEDQLPLIRSELNDVRSAPQDPGGKDIANRDSTVFNALREEAPSVPKVENLLAPKQDNEIQREELLGNTIDLSDPDAVRDAMIKKAEQHARALKEKQEDSLPEAGQFPEPVEGDTTPEETLEYVRSVLDRDDVKTIHPVEEIVKAPVQAPSVKPNAKPVAKPVKQATKQEPVVTTKTAAPVKATSGSRYVQLGSFKSQSAAQDQWAKMKRDFPSVLGGLTLRVQKADLGAKGVYYRVQAGSVSLNSAKSICSTINAKKSGGCIVAKP